MDSDNSVESLEPITDTEDSVRTPASTENSVYDRVSGRENTTVKNDTAGVLVLQLSSSLTDKTKCPSVTVRSAIVFVTGNLPVIVAVLVKIFCSDSE